MRSRLPALVFLLSITATPVAHADVVIGVFSDAGTTCSFSGNNAGLLTAHVVVRSDGAGFLGVRFKAPIPGCFDAVFVNETLPEGLFSIGDSQTGISIALPACATLPTRVLDITYYSSGGTTPCCEFALAPDPVAGYLQAVDCTQAEIPMQSLTSYLNADSTCTCSAPATPPNTPVIAYPPDGATSVNPIVALAWTCTDPQDLAVTCDLYLGTSPNPPLFAANVPGYGGFTYVPPRLLTDTIYYWRVVGRNSEGTETAGPVWQFRTRPNDIPVVTLTSPGNGATGVSIPALLKWTGTDSSPLAYDVYLGTDPLALPAVATGITTSQYSASSLSYVTTYYWYVVAHDLDGGTGSSTTRSFTTRPANYPPNAPFSPSPANNATNVSVSPNMSWGGSDPDGQPLTYDVYLGTTNSPPLVASNVLPPYRPDLQMFTKYYWRVVARDPFGLTSMSSLWNFTTKANVAPSVPSNPSPANGAIKQPTNSTLAWTCTDPDGQALAYDVYFGTTSPPPLVATNHSAASYDPGPQNYQTMYYWRIVARDTFGAETGGSVWAYTTKSEDESPTFTSAWPADNAVNVPTNLTLQWSFVEPEGQPLTYDVYFGTDVSPPLVADHITDSTYNPGQLITLTRYFWKVVARDPAGHETPMAVRSFLASGGAPFAPSNPSPPDNGYTSSTMPLLAWQGGDPDGNPVQYLVYMSVYDASLILIGSTTSPSLQVVQPLVFGRTYSWYVTANDGQYTTQGPLWSFTVSQGPVPVAFASFEAAQDGGAVDVRWKLVSDETLELYTLYRREDGGRSVELARGRVEGASGSYRDTAIAAGTTYSYELVVRSSSGDEFRSPVATVSTAMLELLLHQNVPNPFNPQTTIRYELPAPAHVRLAVFDVNGRLIRTLVDGDGEAGAHESVWTGRDDMGNPVSSGVYFYVLESGKQRLTRKLVLLK